MMDNDIFDGYLFSSEKMESLLEKNTPMVILAKSIEDLPTLHEFYTCTLDFFNIPGNRCRVKAGHDSLRNVVTLTASSDGIPFEHAPHCPCRMFKQKDTVVQLPIAKVRIAASVCKYY
jgi:hypothetical protein